jgi:hypothetical protein
MDFFESTEDVDQQIERSRAALERIEGDVSAKDAMIRLRASQPYHPVLVLRWVFLGLAILMVVAALAALIQGFLQVGPPELFTLIDRVQTAMGVAVPVVIAAGAALLFLAWVAISQAAVAIGADSPLTPVEEKERDRLASDLSRLVRQRQMMEKAKAATPKGARSRFDVPRPSMASQSMPSNYDAPEPAPTYLGGAVPTMVPPQPGGPSSPGRNTPGGGFARFRTPASKMRETGPVSRATPVAAPSAAGAPEWVSEDRVDQDVDDIETPTDQFADMPADASPAAVVNEVEAAGDWQEATADGPSYVTDTASGQGSAFVRPMATAMPEFGANNEDWLQDAITKAGVLAESFPIQARLEFNQDEHLPFTLVLERATPAMAVRATMAYIEFLATIATPRRGRIVLSSVAHLDRSFHRNVRAAAEPYFGSTIGIENQQGQIELTFEKPDARWDRYPSLPTH